MNLKSNTELAIELLSGREWDNLTEEARRILDTRAIEYNGVSAYYIEILPLIAYELAYQVINEGATLDPSLVDYRYIADLLRDAATRLDTED